MEARASSFTHLKGSPGLRSASALVTDADGNIIYGKDIDAVRPIDSITKLMTAMVILDSGLDLNEKITVTREDRDLVQLTGSRLEYGATLSRREMILLAIMSSENRAATALGRNWPGGMVQFVAQMNTKAAQLSMGHSHFTDPAGLNAENISTASDLVKMITAANDYPLIRQASTTQRQTTNEYFQYLFEPWNCSRTKPARTSQIHLQYMYATDPRRPYFTRSFRSTGPSSSLSWPARVSTYRPT